jgi:hypothetical protein
VVVKIEPGGAILELEDGQFRLARKTGEDDASLLMRVSEIVRMTPKQRRGLAQRQRMAQQRLDAGQARDGDAQVATLASAARKPLDDRARVAAALDASGIADRLFSDDDVNLRDSVDNEDAPK